MATFTCPMTIATVTGEGARTVDALVGTQATYCVLPASILNEVGIQPTRTGNFRRTDGSRDTLPLGEMRVTIDGIRGVTSVVFGPEDTTPVIGFVALQSLCLAVAPEEQRLVPTPALLLSPRVAAPVDSPRRV